MPIPCSAPGCSNSSLPRGRRHKVRASGLPTHMDHPAPVHVLFCLMPRCKTWTHTCSHASPRLVAAGPHVKSWTATFPIVQETCRTQARISDPDTPIQQGARRSDCLSEGEVAPCCQHLLRGLHMSGAGKTFFAHARFHVSACRRREFNEYFFQMRGWSDDEEIYGE